MRTISLDLRPQLRLRQLALIAGAGALAISATLAGRAIVDFQDYASDHLVEFSASYKTIPDVAALSRQSDLVIVGTVADNGNTRFLAHDTSAPKANPAPQAPNTSGKKADALKSEANVAVAPAVVSNASANVPGTPITTFDVQVQRVLRGNAAIGSQIQVSMPGGHVQLDSPVGKVNRTVEFEHDTLMQAGEQHVMFLKNAGDGTFFVVGGPQGRLSVDKGGKLHPIDPASPAHVGRQGQLLESLANEVTSVR